MFRFPAQEDIRLQKAPLAEVICQVRFPPILRITEEKPIAFQERVRKQFPKLQVEHGIQLSMSSQKISPPAAHSEASSFRFGSRDGSTTVTLAPDFYALSTKAYTHWSNFLEHLLLINEAASSVYEIPYSIRIGLRYINRLSMENTGKKTIAELWDILRPELTVLLRENCWDDPIEMLNQLLLAGEEGENLTLRTAFKRETQSESFFLLDFDCYVQDDTTLDELSKVCERFHDIIYRAFRWCIREDQLVIFDPVPINEKDEV